MSGPSADPFYLRYYAGHVGSYGHEFLEFELSQGRLRFALNSNYRNEGLIRREMHLSQATLDAIKKIVDASQIVKEDDQNWPKKNVVGKQELEVKLGNYHISFEVSLSCGRSTAYRRFADMFDLEMGADGKNRFFGGCAKLVGS